MERAAAASRRGAAEVRHGVVQHALDRRALVAGKAITSSKPISASFDVVEILEEVGRQVGFPKAIRVDQGTEFVSRDLDLWAYQRGVTLDFSRPGKPTDNAFIESFNGKFRAECLNAHWFMSLDDARRKCEAWRRDYNEERPHSAIGNKAPVELIDRSVAHGPP